MCVLFEWMQLVLIHMHTPLLSSMKRIEEEKYTESNSSFSFGGLYLTNRHVKCYEIA
jgi:hypothetical protein